MPVQILTSKRREQFVALAVLGASFAVPALAQSSPVPVDNTVSITSLTPGAGDVSMKLLHEVLGDWSGPSNQSFVGQAFLYFNSGIMVFAAMMFVYISVMSVLKSAEDGEFMGRSWSSMWIPLRLTVGMALIFPTASGYSMVQMLVLWIASQGVGFANLIWTHAAEGLINSQGDIVAVRLVDQGAAQNLMGTILKAELCIAEQNRFHQTTVFKRQVVLDGDALSGSGGGGSIAWGNTSDKISGYSSTVCGKISIPTDAFTMSDPSSYLTPMKTVWEGVKIGKGAVRTAQLNGILAAAQTLAPLATRLSSVGRYADGTDISLPPTQEILSGINQATGVYRAAIATGAQKALGTQTGSLTKSFLADTKTTGWIGAGGWYFQMARINSELNKITSYTPTIEGAEQGFFYAMNDQMGSFIGGNENVTGTVTASSPISRALDSILANAAAINNDPRIPRLGQSGAGTTQGSIAGVVNNVSNIATGTATSWVAEGLSIDPDPSKPNAVVQLKTVGDYLISSAETVLVASKVASVAATKFTPAGTLAAGFTSFKDKFLNSTAGSLTEPLGMTFFLGVMALLGFGLMLAFWLPMVPFVIWTGSVLGWLMTVIEMVIAGTIWAAAHLHPEGEGMAGKWGANGYMILAELFARPALMIFGFLFAAVTVDPFLKFSSSLFFNSMDTVNADSVSGLVTMVAFVIMYSAFCLSMVIRIYSLITIIPGSVLRIVGASQAGTHDQGQDAANELKQSSRQGVEGAIDVARRGAGMAGAAAAGRRSQGEPSTEEAGNEPPAISH